MNRAIAQPIMRFANSWNSTFVPFVSFVVAPTESTGQRPDRLLGWCSAGWPGRRLRLGGKRRRREVCDDGGGRFATTAAGGLC